MQHEFVSLTTTRVESTAEREWDALSDAHAHDWLHSPISKSYYILFNMLADTPEVQGHSCNRSVAVLLEADAEFKHQLQDDLTNLKGKVNELWSIARSSDLVAEASLGTWWC